ncbi:hypothetical protein P9847_01315 [Paenibacillus chibensis]|uniref:Uncharacterized protein n=1 Tax=Paenibacillus chibensis TaxID=59846 RepID=A0ABU6PM90_9BACL|nr:hypothetical protein [Paenibacillus chibensis]
MSNLIKKLHDLVYKNTIWPQDLLQNLQDPDYLNVNFNSYLDGTCAEVVFMDQGKKITTNYYFCKKSFLQKVEMIEDDRSFIIYDRIEEITKLLIKLDRLNELEHTLKLLAA